MLEGSTCSLGLPSRLAVSSCALDDQSLRFSFGPRVPASRLELRLPGSSIAGVSPEYRWNIAGVTWVPKTTSQMGPMRGSESQKLLLKPRIDFAKVFAMPGSILLRFSLSFVAQGRFC